MKVAGHLVSLLFFEEARVRGLTSAFTVTGLASKAVVRSSAPSGTLTETNGDISSWTPATKDYRDIRAKSTTVVETADVGLSIAPPRDFDHYPVMTIFPKMETVQGGGTVHTYQMPQGVERCQYMLATNGRPLKAKVELWLGPQRTTHTLECDVEDGKQTPVKATLKFKNLAPVLKISSTGDNEFPLYASVSVPAPNRAKQLSDRTDAIFDASYGTDALKLIQGGQYDGKGGALRVWTVPPEVDAVQLIVTSKNTGKKSVRMVIDVLQGPNNNKQTYMLQCGGGCQPYHVVFQTPGPGCSILIKNLKAMEDGNVEIAILPYGDALP